MIRALYTAATGMEAQQINIEVIANNLANSNTSGYKRGRADFQELLYQTLRQPGSSSSDSTKVPTGIQIGLGVRPAAVQKLYTEGDMQNTGNDLDLAIEGKGFFQVLQPNGEKAYTRSGAFKMDADGKLVTSDGYPVEPAITIPTDSTKISIGQDGRVSVVQAGQTNTTEVGQMELAYFANPAGLNSLGRNLMLPTDASGAAQTGKPGDTNGLGTVSQGFVELSNVNVVEEMVGMITAQRAYEINSKVIQSSDEMMKVANQVKQ
ncbi:MAG TPA: flagellar basal-body rod protein FlgG [Nitrospirota bacterium]|jgi:flagellar basal-body rod protein FlgG